MSDPARGFIAGLSPRHDESVARLRHAVAHRSPGFAPADLIARIERAFGGDGDAGGKRADGGADGGVRPKHFVPADAARHAGAPPSPAAPGTDPVEAARATGYEEGMAAARDELAAQAARDRALIETLAAALDGRHDREALATRLRDTVLQLVARVIDETGIDGDLLARRVAAAAALIADSEDRATLLLNPGDMALLAGRLPASVTPVADSSVARGSFVLDGAGTLVEDGPDLWLDQLRAALDRVAVPGGR